MVRQRKRERNSRLVFVCITAVLVLLAIAGGKLADRRRTAADYERAVALMDCGEYAAAKKVFSGLKDKHHLDTDAYLAWCKALEYQEDGHYFLALDEMEDAEFTSMTEEQKARLQAFLSELEEEFAEQRRWGEEESRKAYEESRKAYYKKLSGLVPYVGLAESDIGLTSLGEPSRVESRRIRFKDYTDYFFDRDGFPIFAARCCDSVVTSVYDARSPKSGSSGGTSSGSTGKGSSRDPYDVNGYLHPEDFYYDHIDDFYDYEEAEDYYNAHYGK